TQTVVVRRVTTTKVGGNVVDGTARTPGGAGLFGKQGAINKWLKARAWLTLGACDVDLAAAKVAASHPGNYLAVFGVGGYQRGVAAAQGFDVLHVLGNRVFSLLLARQ